MNIETLHSKELLEQADPSYRLRPGKPEQMRFPKSTHGEAHKVAEIYLNDIASEPESRDLVAEAGGRIDVIDIRGVMHNERYAKEYDGNSYNIYDEYLLRQQQSDGEYSYQPLRSGHVISVGRDTESPFDFADTVSRHHLNVGVTPEGHLSLEDMNSTNGTVVVFEKNQYEVDDNASPENDDPYNKSAAVELAMDGSEPTGLEIIDDERIAKPRQAEARSARI